MRCVEPGRAVKESSGPWRAQGEAPSQPMAEPDRPGPFDVQENGTGWHRITVDVWPKERRRRGTGCLHAAAALVPATVFALFFSFERSLLLHAR